MEWKPADGFNSLIFSLMFLTRAYMYNKTKETGLVEPIPGIVKHRENC